MENWQVALIVLSSVVVGALIPALVMLSVVLYRAAREIATVGRLLGPTLLKVQAISARIETVSRGLDGGEKTIAECLSVAGDLSRSMERNMKLINVASAVLAAAAPAVAAFIQSMRAPDGARGHVEGSQEP